MATHRRNTATKAEARPARSQEVKTQAPVAADGRGAEKQAREEARAQRAGAGAAEKEARAAAAAAEKAERGAAAAAEKEARAVAAAADKAAREVAKVAKAKEVAAAREEERAARASAEEERAAKRVEAAQKPKEERAQRVQAPKEERVQKPREISARREGPARRPDQGVVASGEGAPASQTAAPALADRSTPSARLLFAYLWKDRAGPRALERNLDRPEAVGHAWKPVSLRPQDEACTTLSLYRQGRGGHSPAHRCRGAAQLCSC